MRETEYYFSSADGESKIHTLIWEPDNLANKSPLGILQILHGMAEHIERYRDFATYCTTQGFIVCGHSCIGHGKSVSSPNQWGVMPPDGKTILVKDAHYLRQKMLKRYTVPGTDIPLPYLMLGHSMGSFILRVYLAEHSEGLTAAILCGTGQQPAMLSAAGCFLARFLYVIKGTEHRSTFLHNLTVGAYSKQISGARTQFDWISRDESVVNAYSAAEDCGFMFGSGGNITLTTLSGTMVKTQTAQAVPKDLPLLFIAGDEDPVGEKGAGVKRAVTQFKDTGHNNVTLILYEGMRHEILNEIGKEHVYQDIMDWMKKRVSTVSQPDV